MTKNLPTVPIKPSIPTPALNLDSLKFVSILAEKVHRSKIFGNISSPADAEVRMLLAMSLGLTPFQGLQHIISISGKPSLKETTMRALVLRSGLLESLEETYDEGKKIATCTAKRFGIPNPIVRTFSWGDAEKAGLTIKLNSIYKLYPQRMLSARAASFVWRDGFSDVTHGLYTFEELEDGAKFADATTVEEIVPPALKPISTSYIIDGVTVPRESMYELIEGKLFWIQHGGDKEDLKNFTEWQEANNAAIQLYMRENPMEKEMLVELKKTQTEAIHARTNAEAEAALSADAILANDDEVKNDTPA